MTSTTTVIDVECHVLPILRLAHFAAQAGDVLHEFHSLRQAAPEFQQFNDKWIPCMKSIDPPTLVKPSALRCGLQ
jgi:hypothetical protein